MEPKELTAWIESVYDGDTFTVVVEYPQGDRTVVWTEPREGMLFGPSYAPGGSREVRERIRVRLLGIDAPEVRGDEKEEGKVSAEWVRSLTRNVDHVIIQMHKRDSFGRWLCDVQVGDVDLASAMLEAGMATVYAKSRGASEQIQIVPW